MTKPYTASSREAVPVGAVRVGGSQRGTAARNGAAGEFLGTDAKYKNIGGIDTETGEIHGGLGGLGTYTNTASARTAKIETIDPETGEIIEVFRKDGQLVEQKQAFNPRVARATKFKRLDAIRTILGKDHRTAKCMWCRFTKSNVQVVKDIKANAARYVGLIACSRVWTCPVCSSKISSRRAEELKAAMTQAKAQGLRVALLTVTVPHVRADALEPLLASLLMAWRSFTSDRQAKFLRKAIGLVGTIRNIEVTHGINGWHPHFHCLVFYEKEVHLPTMEQRWGEHWQACAVKAGLRKPSDAHGLTVQNGDYASAYVSKWGLEHEMTMSMSKVARKGGRTPFDIADDFAAGIDQEQNAKLFREFADAFHRKQQLFWSKGLKKLLAVVEKTDEEVVEEEDARLAELVIELTWPEFKAIRKHHRATVLDIAETEPALLRDFIDRAVSS